MAFKMKGSAFKLNNVATKSALKQVDLSNLDQEYVDELLEKTEGDESYPAVNKAHRKKQRREIHEDVKDLKFGKGLNKAMREEKRLQNERVFEKEGVKDRDYYKKFSTNEDGTKDWGPEIKRPKWWSSGKRKKDYIKTMQGRQIQDLRKEPMSLETRKKYEDAGIDPTTMGRRTELDNE
jgi:hypothetical protein